MKHLIIYLTALLTFHCTGKSAANSIVTPWRAKKEIVLAGENFPILYQNIVVSKIDEVYLKGPYNQVNLIIDSVIIDYFQYDSFTQKAVNNKIWVSVPSDTPEELYDLHIKCNGEIHISRKSVKVLKAVDQPVRFIHISDPHVSRQWIGTPENGYAKELELLDGFIEVANIIAPDFVIVTGDIIHHYTRFNADHLGWGGDKVYDADQRPLVEEKYQNYYNGAGGFRGIHGFDAPVFSLPGNHDSYGVSREDHMAMARQWNEMCGKRVYGFTYGSIRVIAADDYLGDPIEDIPDSAPMSGLQGKVFEEFFKNEGMGEVRIMAQHRPNRIDTSFLNKYDIAVLLNGHRHNPHHEYVGEKPTLSMRPGAVCRSGEIRDWEEKLGFFRIISIDGNEVSFSQPLRFCENPTQPYDQLDLKLTLNFNKENDGSQTHNEVVLNNKFDIDLSQCKVRFVMKKGEYKVTGGEIKQIIQSEDKTVVDVLTTISSRSKRVISIEQNR